MIVIKIELGYRFNFFTKVINFYIYFMKWTRKYKKSINCKRPRGFSQKQYCKSKKRPANKGPGKKSIKAMRKWITLKKKGYSIY